MMSNNKKLFTGNICTILKNVRTAPSLSIINYQLSILLLVAVCLVGCKKPTPTPPPVDPDSKVFIMYDNIDDNLGRPFTDNVNAAGRAVAAGALIEGQRVVVFHRWQPDGSVIYELVRDKSAKEGFRKQELKKYKSNEMNTLSKETIAAVVGKIRDLAPANHYGLAFGSHGMGWLPKSSTVSVSRKVATPGEIAEKPFAEFWEVPENSMTRYLANNSEKIDIGDFADGLDGEEGDRWEWDFILFDDCFMASVEALYEIRHLAHYFIASPTEIMMYGFPYDRVVKVLFNDWTNLAGVADAFVEAYRAKDEDDYPNATVAVVQANQLDALATTVKNLNLTENELTSVDGIQYYEGYSRPGHVFFDIDGYLRVIRKDTEPYRMFKAQLERTVVFKDHTEKFYSGYPRSLGTKIEIKEGYSGLNVFIPWSGTAPLFSMYRQTAWYKDVYAE